MLRNMTVLATAAAMAVTPVVAHASAAQALSPSARAGATVSDENNLEGTGLYIVGAIALGLLIWGIIEIADNDDDLPTSP
ncbi:hypothetical protein SAMN06295910_2137 [Allosphingosinicella indica]|uniref:Uncharacterized protein n=2 Tax=Allosphingosinicella indica TaxID=941907 RepID=A0A1X7GR94_9SPHN|nr:hypothetical protein SAMN06295910_2137 [Allosphingosinicella indica]